MLQSEIHEIRAVNPVRHVFNYLIREYDFTAKIMAVKVDRSDGSGSVTATLGKHTEDSCACNGACLTCRDSLTVS